MPTPPPSAAFQLLLSSTFIASLLVAACTAPSGPFPSPEASVIDPDLQPPQPQHDTPAPADDSGAPAASSDHTNDSQLTESSDWEAPPTQSITRSLESMLPAERYRQGLALEQEGASLAAAAAFQSYGEALPEMLDIAAMAEGNARFAAGDYAGAETAFQTSFESAQDDLTAFLASLRLGNARLRTAAPFVAGDTQTGARRDTRAAIAAYDRAFSLAGDADQRGQALAGRIAAELAGGDESAAQATRLRLVREHPTATLAEPAMTRLLQAGMDLSDHDRARVSAGRGRLQEAIALLAPSVEGSAANRSLPAEAVLDLCRWLSESAEHTRLLAVSGDFLGERRDAAQAPQVAWLRARSLARLDRLSDAAETYDWLARSWPRTQEAADAQWSRAWLLLRQSGPEASGEAFAALADAQPGDPRAAEARFRAGFSEYWAGDPRAATQQWSRAAGAQEPRVRAQANYWLGKLAEGEGNRDRAEEHWSLAAAADPLGHYGLRASAKLHGEARVFELAQGESPEALQSWMRTWRGGIAGGAEVDGIDGQILEVKRAAAFLDLDRRDAAQRALHRGISAHWNRPATLAALSEQAAALDLYKPSLGAAAGLLSKAPPASRAKAPAVLARLAYPSPMAAELQAAANAQDVEPTLLLALIRQESRFDAEARSPAGALGLTQVMPATGRQVAGWLSEPDYRPEQLLQPETALRYGAAYLAAQLERFDGAVLPALAAYNAGPSNAERWHQLSGGDPDRFLEIIDFKETRAYVRKVSENRLLYQQLYR